MATLQVTVRLRGAQMADPEMTSALTVFRRAANVLARLEDAVVFRGLYRNRRTSPASGRLYTAIGGLTLFGKSEAESVKTGSGNSRGTTVARVPTASDHRSRR